MWMGRRRAWTLNMRAGDAIGFPIVALVLLLVGLCAGIVSAGGIQKQETKPTLYIPPAPPPEYTEEETLTTNDDLKAPFRTANVAETSRDDGEATIKGTDGNDKFGFTSGVNVYGETYIGPTQKTPRKNKREEPSLTPSENRVKTDDSQTPKTSDEENEPTTPRSNKKNSKPNDGGFEEPPVPPGTAKTQVQAGIHITDKPRKPQGKHSTPVPSGQHFEFTKIVPGKTKAITFEHLTTDIELSSKRVKRTVTPSGRQHPYPAEDRLRNLSILCAEIIERDCLNLINNEVVTISSNKVPTNALEFAFDIVAPPESKISVDCPVFMFNNEGDDKCSDSFLSVYGIKHCQTFKKVTFTAKHPNSVENTIVFRRLTPEASFKCTVRRETPGNEKFLDVLTKKEAIIRAVGAPHPTGLTYTMLAPKNAKISVTCPVFKMQGGCEKSFLMINMQRYCELPKGGTIEVEVGSIQNVFIEAKLAATGEALECHLTSYGGDNTACGHKNVTQLTPPTPGKSIQCIDLLTEPEVSFESPKIPSGFNKKIDVLYHVMSIPGVSIQLTCSKFMLNEDCKKESLRWLDYHDKLCGITKPKGITAVYGESGSEKEYNMQYELNPDNGVNFPPEHGFTCTITRMAKHKDVFTLDLYSKTKITFEKPKGPGNKDKQRETVTYYVVSPPGAEVTITCSQFHITADDRCQSGYMRIGDHVFCQERGPKTLKFETKYNYAEIRFKESVNGDDYFRCEISRTTSSHFCAKNVIEPTVSTPREQTETESFTTGLIGTETTVFGTQTKKSKPFTEEATSLTSTELSSVSTGLSNTLSAFLTMTEGPSMPGSSLEHVSSPSLFSTHPFETETSMFTSFTKNHSVESFPLPTSLIEKENTATVTLPETDIETISTLFGSESVATGKTQTITESPSSEQPTAYFSGSKTEAISSGGTNPLGKPTTAFSSGEFSNTPNIGIGSSEEITPSESTEISGTEIETSIFGSSSKPGFPSSSTKHISRVTPVTESKETLPTNIETISTKYSTKELKTTVPISETMFETRKSTTPRNARMSKPTEIVETSTQISHSEKTGSVPQKTGTETNTEYMTLTESISKTHVPSSGRMSSIDTEHEVTTPTYTEESMFTETIPMTGTPVTEQETPESTFEKTTTPVPGIETDLTHFKTPSTKTIITKRTPISKSENTESTPVSLPEISQGTPTKSTVIETETSGTSQETPTNTMPEISEKETTQPLLSTPGSGEYEVSESATSGFPLTPELTSNEQTLPTNIETISTEMATTTTLVPPSASKVAPSKETNPETLSTNVKIESTLIGTATNKASSLPSSKFTIPEKPSSVEISGWPTITPNSSYAITETESTSFTTKPVIKSSNETATSSVSVSRISEIPTKPIETEPPESTEETFTFPKITSPVLNNDTVKQSHPTRPISIPEETIRSSQLTVTVETTEPTRAVSLEKQRPSSPEGRYTKLTQPVPEKSESAKTTIISSSTTGTLPPGIETETMQFETITKLTQPVPEKSESAKTTIISSSTTGTLPPGVETETMQFKTITSVIPTSSGEITMSFPGTAGTESIQTEVTLFGTTTPLSASETVIETARSYSIGSPSKYSVTEPGSITGTPSVHKPSQPINERETETVYETPASESNEITFPEISTPKVRSETFGQHHPTHSISIPAETETSLETQRTIFTSSYPGMSKTVAETETTNFRTEPSLEPSETPWIETEGTEPPKATFKFPTITKPSPMTPVHQYFLTPEIRASRSTNMMDVSTPSSHELAGSSKSLSATIGTEETIIVDTNVFTAKPTLPPAILIPPGPLKDLIKQIEQEIKVNHINRTVFDIVLNETLKLNDSKTIIDVVKYVTDKIKPIIKYFPLKEKSTLGLTIAEFLVQYGKHVPHGAVVELISTFLKIIDDERIITQLVTEEKEVIQMAEKYYKQLDCEDLKRMIHLLYMERKNRNEVKSPCSGILCEDIPEELMEKIEALVEKYFPNQPKSRWLIFDIMKTLNLQPAYGEEPSEEDSTGKEYVAYLNKLTSGAVTNSDEKNVILNRVFHDMSLWVKTKHPFNATHLIVAWKTGNDKIPLEGIRSIIAMLKIVNQRKLELTLTDRKEILQLGIRCSKHECAFLNPYDIHNLISVFCNMGYRNGDLDEGFKSILTDVIEAMKQQYVQTLKVKSVTTKQRSKRSTDSYVNANDMVIQAKTEVDAYIKTSSSKEIKSLSKTFSQVSITGDVMLQIFTIIESDSHHWKYLPAVSIVALEKYDGSNSCKVTVKISKELQGCIAHKDCLKADNISDLRKLGHITGKLPLKNCNSGSKDLVNVLEAVFLKAKTVPLSLAQIPAKCELQVEKSEKTSWQRLQTVVKKLHIERDK